MKQVYLLTCNYSGYTTIYDAFDSYELAEKAIQKLEANRQRVGGWDIEFVSVYDTLPDEVKPIMRLQSMY